MINILSLFIHCFKDIYDFKTINVAPILKGVSLKVIQVNNFLKYSDNGKLKIGPDKNIKGKINSQA